MTQLMISLVQMDIAYGDPARNFAHVEQRLGEAAARSVEGVPHLVLLPELWSSAYDLGRAAELAQPLADGPDGSATGFGRMATLAQQHGLWLAGSLLEVREGRQYNCLAVYSPQGALAGVYRKVHLFRLMQEEQFLAPGPALTCAQTPWGEVGLSICYDLRFPELFRAAAVHGARLMLVPAEWPNPRRMHWRTLLRARAIENQCFVAACNRVGVMGQSSFFGASAVIDPWGETLVEGEEEAALLTVTIDLDLVDTVRARIPVFADRRTDLYG